MLATSQDNFATHGRVHRAGDIRAPAPTEGFAEPGALCRATDIRLQRAQLFGNRFKQARTQRRRVMAKTGTLKNWRQALDISSVVFARIRLTGSRCASGSRPTWRSAVPGGTATDTSLMGLAQGRRELEQADRHRAATWHLTRSSKFGERLQVLTGTALVRLVVCWR